MVFCIARFRYKPKGRHNRVGGIEEAQLLIRADNLPVVQSARLTADTTIRSIPLHVYEQTVCKLIYELHIQECPGI